MVFIRGCSDPKSFLRTGDCVSGKNPFLSCHNSPGRWGAWCLRPEGLTPPQRGLGDRSDLGLAPILMSNCQPSPGQNGNREGGWSQTAIRVGARGAGVLAYFVAQFFFFLRADSWAWMAAWRPLPRERGSTLAPRNVSCAEAILGYLRLSLMLGKLVKR